MPAVHKILRVIRFGCYSLFREVFHLTRNLVWMVQGTYWEAYRNRTVKECYMSSAHVHRIIGRFKYDVLLGPASYRDFILYHDRFENPDYILKDNVTLYKVTKDMAIFVEVPENIDAWRCEYGSFIRQVQFNLAKRVITMPLHSFHVLADKVGDPKAKMVFVQNVARCGSTLLVRVFEETGRCVAFSEPDAMNGVASYTVKTEQWRKDELAKVTRDSVRLLCKPCKSVPNPDAYLMKMTILSIEGVPVLKQLFPEAAHLFMYRDCLKVTQSLMRAREVLPLLDLALGIHYLIPSLTLLAVKWIGLATEDYLKQNSVDSKHTCVILWSVIMTRYLYMRDNGCDMAGIAYEDLHADPEYCIKVILKYCGLSEQLATKGMKAFDKDAQGNSALAAENLRSLKVDDSLSKKTTEQCNATLKRAGLPYLGQPCFLPGTITHKAPIQWPTQYDSQSTLNGHY